MTRFIAHRGLSSVYYQNSEKAFRAPAESPFFYGIETDVWFTKDNKWVCCHDNNPFVDKSVSISEITYEEALKMPMNPNKLGSVKIEGESYICSMEKYLEICKAGGKVPVIELKCKPGKEKLRELLSIVDGIVGIDNAIFISFHFVNLARLRAMNEGPDLRIRTQVLGKYPTSGRAYLKKGYDVDLMFTYCTGALIRRAHKLGHEVNLWTINRLGVARYFVRLGVDYITTNFDFGGRI